MLHFFRMSLSFHVAIPTFWSWWSATNSDQAHVNPRLLDAVGAAGASLRTTPMQVDFEQQKLELFQPESVSQWFMLDCKLGSLLLGLEPPGCFGADFYAADLHLTDPDDDQRFNYGEHLLRAALLYWCTRSGPAAAWPSTALWAPTDG